MPIKILSVDDELDMEDLIRQKFRRPIRKGEMEFLFAHNGIEALKVIEENPDVGLILSDINMPEMDGLTLLGKVAEKNRSDIKTIIISAYGDMENIRTAMNRGAFDFVTKPINFDDLDTTIKKTLKEVERIRASMKDKTKLTSIEKDLSTANEIQLSILPKKFPKKDTFELFASMNAAKMVGGDFYDFFMIDDNQLGIVMADVSGKGIPAAIFMAVSRTIIKATALKGIEPGVCLAYANDLLCKESVNSMFVTAFYGILNLSTGQFKFSNGGHNLPYQIKKSGEVLEIPKTGNMILGIMDGLPYGTSTIQLDHGDSLFLFTDGVSEAENEAKELFGEERLIEILKSNPAASAEEFCKSMFAKVKEFAGNAEQSDDITMLAVNYY